MFECDRQGRVPVPIDVYWRGDLVELMVGVAVGAVVLLLPLGVSE